MNGNGIFWDPIGEMSRGVTIPAAQLISPEIVGGFPATAFMEPDLVEPSWLGSIWKPLENFGQNLWKAGTQSIEQVSESLPDLLWGWGLRELGGVFDRPKERVVDEGAGVKVIYSEAPHAGGEPAQPPPAIIPGQWPTIPTWMAPAAAGVPQAKVPTALLLIGAGLVVVYVLLKR